MLFRNFSEAVGLSPSDASTVSCYIIATKRHDVLDSEDQDLRAFIDLDMAVIGRERIAYFTYASQVKACPLYLIYSVYVLVFRTLSAAKEQWSLFGSSGLLFFVTGSFTLTAPNSLRAQCPRRF